jgi:predicted NAD/FAD-binding protein
MVDNGQHILIGAYTESLRLMRTVGVDPSALLRLPLTLRFADGMGLRDAPEPLDGGRHPARPRRRWSERPALLRAALGWRAPALPARTTRHRGHAVPRPAPRLMAEFIEPLCVAALNTPATRPAALARAARRAAGRARPLPCCCRASTWARCPRAAARWLRQRGAVCAVASASTRCTRKGCTGVGGQAFDRVIWATSAPHAVKALTQSASEAPNNIAIGLRDWCATTARLAHRAITTVYAQAPASAALLPQHAGPAQRPDAPAQFVFDRDAITGTREPTGLLAFVASDSAGERPTLQAAIVAQASRELGWPCSRC